MYLFLHTAQSSKFDTLDSHNSVYHGWFTHKHEAGTLQINEKLEKDSSCHIKWMKYTGFSQSAGFGHDLVTDEQCRVLQYSLLGVKCCVPFKCSYTGVIEDTSYVRTYSKVMSVQLLSTLWSGMLFKLSISQENKCGFAYSWSDTSLVEARYRWNEGRHS